MPSWTNATDPGPARSDPDCPAGTGRPDLDHTASTKGVLRPAETARHADLRRDHDVDPALSPFVERYWSVRWDQVGATPFRSEVLSHPSVNLSVEWGDRPRFGAVLPAVLVHGPVTRRFVIDLVGRGRVTAAKFRPGGWTALTGLPPFPDTVAPLRADPGPDAAGLLAAMSARSDDADRVVVLDAALAVMAVEPDPAYLGLLDVISGMLHDRAIVRVEQAAAAAGLSVRSLQRLFACYVGVGPKAVLARYRVQDAAAALDAGADDLAALAASLGWFDQAHFSRDFRRAVGVPPSAYLSGARRSRG